MGASAKKAGCVRAHTTGRFISDRGLIPVFNRRPSHLFASRHTFAHFGEFSVSHTPGPWKLFLPSGRIERDVGDMFDIGNLVCSIGRTPMDDQALANGHLIAAAPDLLAVCEHLVEWESSYSPPSIFLFGAARDAIAKAKGNPLDPSAQGGKLAT
jgi:hypothetical protein